jgi:hypothetical protein
MRAMGLRGAPRQPCAPDASISDSVILLAPARARSREQRTALLAGTMLTGVVLLTALAGQALADGGAGQGIVAASGNGGDGGVGLQFATSPPV